MVGPLREQPDPPPRIFPTYQAAHRFIRALLTEPEDANGNIELPALPGYVVEGRLGEGGSATVHKAREASSGRLVALKVFRMGPDDPDFQVRAWGELELLSQLRLPSGPRVIDYGMHEGRLYVVTDFVEGQTLAEHCASRSLSVRDRVAILIAIAHALDALHTRGIIHRDIKPANIIVTPRDGPVIVDLGIAVRAPIETPREGAPKLGTPAGSMHYMSPEQARGEVGAISTRCDIFSLAATACVTLTGKHPRRLLPTIDDAVALDASHPIEDPQHLDPELPTPLAAILRKSLSLAPEERHVSAGEFASDLQRWLDGDPVPCAHPSRWEYARWWLRRNPQLAGIGAGAMLALLAALTAGGIAVVEARAAAAHAEVAVHMEQLAGAQADLARQRRDYADRIKEQNGKLRSLVSKFVGEAKKNADVGRFGESLAILRGLDDLIGPQGVEDPALMSEHRRQRIEAFMAALRESYQLDLHRGEPAMAVIRLMLESLEDTHAESR